MSCCMVVIWYRQQYGSYMPFCRCSCGIGIICGDSACDVMSQNRDKRSLNSSRHLINSWAAQESEQNQPEKQPRLFPAMNKASWEQGSSRNNLRFDSRVCCKTHFLSLEMVRIVLLSICNSSSRRNLLAVTEEHASILHYISNTRICDLTCDFIFNKYMIWHPSRRTAKSYKDNSMDFIWHVTQLTSHPSELKRFLRYGESIVPTSWWRKALREAV